MGELSAYAVDCLVTGTIDLEDGRLSDRLDTVLASPLRDVRLEDLGDGHVVVVPELTLEPDDLCAVVASEPRGDPFRRLHTRTARVKAEVGPYRIEGTVHGTAASDPIGRALRHDSWVPMTGVTVMYRRGSEDVADDVETLLVNRHLLHHFREADEPVT